MPNWFVKPVDYSISSSREANVHRREVVIDNVDKYTTHDRNVKLATYPFFNLARDELHIARSGRYRQPLVYQPVTTLSNMCSISHTSVASAVAHRWIGRQKNEHTARRKFDNAPGWQCPRGCARPSL